MQYTTLANLKTHLWITGTDRDAELTTLIAKASDMLEFELWQSLDIETVTRRTNGFWNNRVYVESIINSVSSVHYTSDWWYSRQAIDVDFFDWYIIYLKYDAPRWVRNVKVVFEKWYEEVPVDLEQFFLKYCESLLWDSVATEWDKQERVKSKKIGNYLAVTYMWPEELSKNDKAFQVQYESIKDKYKVFSSTRF